MTRRVLVVDDEPDIRELVALSLLVTGWDVVCVESGAQALRLCADGVVDAVLLDVDMPGMDGRETARALRADPVTATVEVVFLTATVDITDLLPLGSVLAKPFDPARLADQVEELLVNPGAPPAAVRA
ncbi:response regulator [Lentzea sp. NPDC060358]|uniref:response regulator n=1 Tax=Lentzea sp. NPDC060358 TaxID=3347103 RepID=UPI00365A648C